MPKGKRVLPKAPLVPAAEQLVFLPQYGNVRDTAKRYGISLRSVYRLMADHPHIARRYYGSTLICFAAVDEVMAALPTARDNPTGREATLHYNIKRRAAEAEAASGQ